MKQTWPPRPIHHLSSEAHPSRRANADIHFAPVPLGWTVIGRSPRAGLPKQRGAFTLGRRNARIVRPDGGPLHSECIETGVVGPKDPPCRFYVKRLSLLLILTEQDASKGGPEAPGVGGGK